LDKPCYKHILAEQISELVASLARDFKVILAPASTFGKNCAPRIAAELDVAQISDVSKIIDANTLSVKLLMQILLNILFMLETL